MVTIGGKTKVKKATQPQFVVKVAEDKNLFLSIKHDDKGLLNLDWIGDPNAATKFDSKYQAKCRVREFEAVPDTRCFMELTK